MKGSMGTDFVKGDDTSQEEVAALLVETEAAERAEQLLFWGGFLVVPGEWRSLSVKTQELGVPVGVREALVRGVVVVEGCLGAAGSRVDLATMAAQVFGKGTEEDRRAKGKAQRKL